MSLTDILKTIKSEAEAEAQKIREDSKEKQKRLKQELDDLIQKSQEKILVDFRRAMEKKVKQTKFLKENATKTLLLRKKQEILDQLYEQVIKRILAKDEIYEQVIKRVTNLLPRIEDGEIVIAKGKKASSDAALLRRYEINYKISRETIPARGGFILKSETLEIDNTIEALVEQARLDTEIEVAKILFREDDEENN